MSLAPPAVLAGLETALAAAFRADATLAGLVGGRIHDGPPRAGVTPYLAFGAAEARDWGSGDGDGARVRLTIETVGTDAERGRVLAVLAAAAAVLAGPPPSLDAGTAVLLRVVATTVGRVDGGRAWRAAMTVEVMVDV
ncbi:DUF3168 domain-containing protein [Oharaeibacter diazotrophicus]|uniref:Uncharacterized protein DUF3168 n=1 Tax=Oharaeibacter diazotrophicus TaxID=1920512 RepID=A0A4R6RAT5_9HYPH|nr:DUF3168 domain-containing protein [Oharaeibacter diazotrophicus]TDP83220.1 uncharacterized protein DUF3168 [Oharaeibacter diazotrophicus]BBE72052.1 hypothetical protein OHA_1_01639 [Pleomorphomonas sp. SM30]GLS78817.1 hypothetical protein GCM10007904_41540 [Oharaeibacter diazotrophicus]